jgi:hypothetical protein
LLARSLQTFAAKVWESLSRVMRPSEAALNRNSEPLRVAGDLKCRTGWWAPDVRAPQERSLKSALELKKRFGCEARKTLYRYLGSRVSRDQLRIDPKFPRSHGSLSSGPHLKMRSAHWARRVIGRWLSFQIISNRSQNPESPCSGRGLLHFWARQELCRFVSRQRRPNY